MSEEKKVTKPKQIAACNFAIDLYLKKILKLEAEINELLNSIAAEVTLRTALEKEMATIGEDL